MAVSVAEYLGQRTDIDLPSIKPEQLGSDVKCPFMDGLCTKLKKNLQPVCSVRKNDNSLWIVCEHRLCATPRTKLVANKRVPASLTTHQQRILWDIAKTIYKGDFKKEDIFVNREVPIPIVETGGTYKADYIMRNKSGLAKIDEILLEMQGGGETNQTKYISNHVRDWASNTARNNAILRTVVSKAGTIETNAWRRQQEQFLVKGNIVNQTGGKIVFAVGKLIYDYLIPRITHANLRDLRKHNWTLCIVAIDEDVSVTPVPGPIPLSIDENRLMFTNYSTFVRTLTDQGGPEPSIFEGEFLSLTGEKRKL